MAQQTGRHRSFDEAKTLEVLVAANDRVEPRCPHFRHLRRLRVAASRQSEQIHAKQRVLLENLERIGHVAPERVLPPLADAAWGYRRRAASRCAGSREGQDAGGLPREQDRASSPTCAMPPSNHPAGGRTHRPRWSALVDGMDAPTDIAQIEFIAGDAQPGLRRRGAGVPPPAAAVGRRPRETQAFGREHRFAIFLQPGGIDSVHALWPADPRLSFRIPRWDIDFAFRPLDFIQVNAGLNEKMIASALELLDLQPGERVLDLFCGLGNFTCRWRWRQPSCRRRRGTPG